jgi:SPP1 gp7 family putative phage head morphogenesis protein
VPKRKRRYNKRDPTYSQPRINRYERRLVGLFPPFAKRVKAYVMSDGTTTRAMEINIPTFTLNEFSKAIQNLIVDALLNPANEIIDDEIPPAYTAGKNWAATNMGQEVATQLFNEQKRIALLVTKNQGAFLGVTEEMSKQIRRVVSEDLLRDEPNYKITKDILKVIEDIGESRARTIARTETMTAVNTGAMDQYKASGVERVEWVGAVDAQSCEDCDELDGKVWDIDEAPVPPLHPNCRCSLAAVVIEDWDTSQLFR